jgi:ribonuclease Z
MIEVGGQLVQAVSVGGLETCIELPRWKLCFDIGRCPPTAQRWSRVLFTHAHVDHMGGVVHHCATRDLLGMSPPTYVMPAENADDFRALLDAWRRLDRSDLPCEVVGVSPGDRIDLGKGRIAVAFRAVHRVPSIGYALLSTRHRLLPELAGAPREAILARKARGEPVEGTVETVEVAFCGDTTIDVVEREAIVRQAKLLILEVTFLDDLVSVEASRHKGHVHLDEVIERAHLFENERLLFTHFSARYSAERIERILEQRLPPGLRERVTALLPQPPWSST